MSHAQKDHERRLVVKDDLKTQVVSWLVFRSVRVFSLFVAFSLHLSFLVFVTVSSWCCEGKIATLFWSVGLHFDLAIS